MTVSVKIDSEGDAVPLQVCSAGDLVIVLLSNGAIIGYSKRKLTRQYKVMVPSCTSVCVGGGKVFAVCSDGKVYEICDEKAKLVCALKNHLSCCAANDKILYVGCADIPHDSSLIHVIDLTTMETKKIEFSHFGDITNVKLYKNTLYSSGVDGLVCEYDADCEVNQVFNGEASVSDFALHDSSVVILTDIHTAVSVDCENGKTVKFGRPNEDVFGVGCLETSKGVKVLFTDANGALSSYRLSGKKLKTDGEANIHGSFVECAVISDNADLATVDEQLNIKMSSYRHLFDKHKTGPIEE